MGGRGGGNDGRGHQGRRGGVRRGRQVESGNGVSGVGFPGYDEQQSRMNEQEFPNDRPGEYGQNGVAPGGAAGIESGQIARYEEYVASYPIKDMLGVHVCVHRIIKFNEDQRKRKHRNNGLDEFWKPFVKEYFTDDSKLLLDVMSKKTKKSHSIELRADALARTFKAKYDSGVLEERLLLENPCEFLLYDGIVVVDCPRTLIITIFPDSYVYTEGHLRVSFSKKLKILCWEFSTKKHEELVKINLPKQPQPAANDLGLSKTYSDYLHIAEVINQLRTSISSAISNLVRQSGTQFKPQ